MRTRPVLSEEVRFRAPPGLLAAAQEAAGRDYRTVAAFMREPVVSRLRELGVPITRERGQHCNRAEREAGASGA
jgi:hypothetical protein